MRKIVKKIIVLCLICFSFSYSKAQISVTPLLPKASESVEVIFNASLGNAGLQGYTGNVYAHTGVITNNSTSTTDWKYVKSDWGVNIPECKLTNLGNDLWKLSINPSIREYYGVPQNEQILQIAFVFRSETQVNGNWLEGKTETNGDILYNVYQNETIVRIVSPNQDFVFSEIGDTLNLEIGSLNIDSLFLYNNSELIFQTNLNSISYQFITNQTGLNYLIAKGIKNNIEIFDTLIYIINPEITIAEMPSGLKSGITVIDSTSVYLCLFAPYKNSVYALGDFNNWLPKSEFLMNRTPDSKYYWLKIENLNPDKEYIFQYLVDQKIRIGDPYCTKVSDPWNDRYIPESTYPNILDYPFNKTSGIASIFKINKEEYLWDNYQYSQPESEDLVIYELLIRDFTEQRSFQSVIDKLPYFKSLGINAIELMPVTEFEGNESWGYNPNYYFAIDKYYGCENKLKELIDSCHKNDIAVILDVVFNHSFGTAPYVMLYWDAVNNRPASNNPFYNQIPKHDFNVGFDMNHESIHTKKYVSDALKYYINEFKFDGFRFDLSKGFTQKNTLGNSSAMAVYDESRVAILTNYYDTIKKYNPKSYVILEHFADNQEEKILSDKGMMLWGNINYQYGEAMMSYINNSDLSWGVYKKRGWQKPNLVTYSESHDEERQIYRCEKWGNSSPSYNIKDTITALKRAELASVFFYTIPGPKMLWQFGELGYDYSINYPSGTSNDRLTPKPPRWDYYDNSKRRKLFEVNSILIKEKKKNPAFKTTNFNVNLTDEVKTIILLSDSGSIVVIGNFDIENRTASIQFPKNGKWFDMFTNDSISIENFTTQILLKPGEYRLYSEKKINFPYRLPSNQSQLDIKIYPNPGSEIINFKIDKKNNNQEIINIEIYSSEGNKVTEYKDESLGKTVDFKWETSKKGVFFAVISSNSYVKVKKIIVI